MMTSKSCTDRIHFYCKTAVMSVKRVQVHLLYLALNIADLVCILCKHCLKFEEIGVYKRLKMPFESHCKFCTPTLYPLIPLPQRVFSTFLSLASCGFSSANPMVPKI